MFIYDTLTACSLSRLITNYPTFYCHLFFNVCILLPVLNIFYCGNNIVMCPSCQNKNMFILLVKLLVFVLLCDWFIVTETYFCYFVEVWGNTYTANPLLKWLLLLISTKQKDLWLVD